MCDVWERWYLSLRPVTPVTRPPISSTMMSTSPEPNDANCEPSDNGATSPLFTKDEAQFLLDAFNQFLAEGATSDASDGVATRRRTRRREIEKRSRRRRQSALAEMRDRVQVLEGRVREMLRANIGEKRTAYVGALGAFHALRWNCIQLIAVILSLENEKKMLECRLQSKKLLSESVAFLSKTFADHWRDFSLDNLLHCAYSPYNHADLFTFLRETLSLVSAKSARKDWVWSGRTLLGWEDQRHVDSSDLFLSFSKRFPHHDPERVMLDSWALFTQEKIFKDTMMPINSFVTLLEVPNDDVMVVHRRTKCATMSYHTVYVLFRLRTDDGFSICFRTFPFHSLTKSLGDNDVWFDTFHWTHFNFIKDEDTGHQRGCEVIFGGQHFDTIERSLLGSFATIARWENAVIAPFFQL